MRTLWLAALVALSACEAKSPEQTLIKAAAPATSWVATLQMASEMWAANSVPTAYVRDSIAAARKTFQKTDKAIGDSDADESVKRSLRQDVRRADVLASSLDAALEMPDRRRAVDPLTHELAELHRSLKQLGHKYER
jgi:hypothetical protein